MRSALIPIALTVLLPFLAEAQSHPVAAGARVRVSAPTFGLDKRVTSVAEVRGDTLVLNLKGGPRPVGLSDISSLEVSAGKRMRVLPHAAVGFVVGAAGGYALGYASYEEGSWFSDSPHQDGLFGGAVLGAVGLVTGAVVGAINRGDHWVAARPSIRASVAPTRSGGMAVSFSRAF